MFFIGLTVLCTATLYYELSVTASVSTLLLVKFHMSFRFFVYTRAIASLIGAFGAPSVESPTGWAAPTWSSPACWSPVSW